ncbi:MAG: response regulator transcription factor [Lentilitoribacter sp.]
MVHSVFVADDHELTINGICNAFDDVFDFEVIGTARNGIDAIAQIKRLSPDAAILDFIIPGATGLEIMVEAKRWSPKTKFIIVTGSPSAQIFSQITDAGADGIFLKSGPVEELLNGVRDIANGRKIIGAGTKKFLNEIKYSDELSVREIEVLQSIARGLSNKQIAEHLGISPKTVDNHRTNMMRKLNVHSTATLLVRAIKDDLITV